MASSGLPVERLRDYLRELDPRAQALLIAELERGLVQGEEIPAAQLVLTELRRTMRNVGKLAPRIGDPAALFFKPLEPFLVDDAADHKHPSRIARVSLEPIWNFVCRDLLPVQAKTYCEQVVRELSTGGPAAAEAVASVFQDCAAQRIQQAFAATQGDQKLRQRLAAQVGTPRAIEDLAILQGVLKARDPLAAFASRLPIHIKNLADEQLDNVKVLIDRANARAPETFVYLLLLVMSRLAAPWQLVRLATRAVESDDAVRVAQSSYGVAVGIVLAEIQRLVAELKQDLATGRGFAVTALLKDIHDAARGLRTELDMPADSNWGRQLAAIRADISNRLKAEIESMPGNVRRLLRPRPAKEIPPGTALDDSEVAEVEALIEFVGACRIYASELAISEMTLRTYSSLQQYLDTVTPSLVDGLRTAEGPEREYRLSQIDAAVRFCAKVFGQDYAVTLAKSAEVAAADERKSARAS